MAGFAKLIPAFTVHIAISAPSQVGTVAKGTGLSHVSFHPGQGFFRSEAGYEVELDAEFIHGADYLRLDPGGKHIRLEVSSLLKDKTSGDLFRYDYTGTIDMSGAAGKVLRGEADAATTEFGEIFTHVKLETGSSKLKQLETKVYVGSGRFILEKDKPVIVEYKISEVAL